MWKRHAGFDVVAYNGQSGTMSVNHSLNKVPEMIWVKSRSLAGENWWVYHKDLGGGTNPEQYTLRLNSSSEAYGPGQVLWNSTAPTITHFSLGDDDGVSKNDSPYIAMLFSSVTGISKVGGYTGSGGAQTITTGFQPRFAIIKRTDAAASWFVFDSLRGWSSGADPYLLLDSNAAQDGAYDMGSAESNGFSLINDTNTNASGGSYIYYAHA